jgi:hypothetical protein
MEPDGTQSLAAIAAGHAGHESIHLKLGDKNVKH